MRLPSALLLLALLSSAPALAQDAKPVWPPCGERPTFEKAFEEATLVLVGRVLQSEGYQQRLVTGNSRRTWRMHRVVIEVSRGWKGQPRDTVLIDTPPPEEDSATTRFAVNESYLLYLHSVPDAAGQRREDTVGRIANLLWDHPEYLRCCRTVTLAAASQDLRPLGPPIWKRR